MFFTFDISTLDLSIMKDDLLSVIMFQIELTSKKAKKFSQKEFDERKLEINIDQWVLLKIVEQYEGASQKELAEKSYRDAASITRSLDLLGKKGMITRESIPSNRRQYSICLTAKGKSFIAENMEMVRLHRNKSLAGFSNDEIEQLKSLLGRIQKNLD